MKNWFFLYYFLTPFLSISQTIIKGTVYEKNGPLEGVAVYFNNTILGTTTNKNGEFTIKVKEGHYEMVVSYLGYKKEIYALDTSIYKEPLIFKLQEEANTLDEIIIAKTIYDEEWEYNLSVFKREFIGLTELAKDCKILNPKVLHFNFDSKLNILTAIARKPLEIIHKSLGYKIIFELEGFEINKNKVIYLGYSRYKNLSGSKRKQRKWKENRLKAYNGSYLHFFQSLINKKAYKDGFIINQFKRIKNKERPNEIELKKAREIVKLNSKNINFSIKINNPKTSLDSAIVVLQKVKLPKFRDYLYKSKVEESELISYKNGRLFLNFENNLSIVYTKELEEKAYILRGVFSKIRKALPQTSSIIPIKMPIEIDKNGFLINPLEIFFEGYWSFEKFANSLPIDYTPEK